MSSDRTGTVDETAAVPEHASDRPAAAVGAGRDVGDDAQPDDPWFAPGSKTDADAAGSQDVPADAHDADSAGGPGGRQAEWFLRTGRAGLLPDSMTVAWDDDVAPSPSADHDDVRVAAAGAPPWAGETTDVSANAP